MITRAQIPSVLFAFILLCLVQSQVRAQWTQTNGPYGAGGVRCFASSGEHVFAGTNGGVFVSTNNGSDWSQSGLRGIEVRALVVTPDGGGGTNLFAATFGRGVFITSDDGAKWTSVNAGLSDSNVTALLSMGHSLVAGTIDAGVFRSTDNGKSWSTMNAGLTEHLVWALTSIDSNVFASINQNGTSWSYKVYRWSKSDTSWRLVINGMTSTQVGSHIHSLAVAYNENGGADLLAGGDKSDVFLSTDNGTIWARMNYGLTGLGLTSVNALGYSTGGPNSMQLIAGTSAGAFRSTNNGASWNVINNGLRHKDISSLFFKDSALFAGTYAGGIYLSTDGGDYWQEVNAGLSNSSSFALSAHGQDLFAGTYSGVFKSTNNGGDWMQTGLNSGQVTSIAYGVTNIFAGTFGKTICDTENVLLVSSDNGENWHVRNSYQWPSMVLALAVRDSFLVAGGYQGLSLSTNDGTDWQIANFSGPINSIAFADTVLFASRLRYVTRLTVGGIGWRDALVPCDNNTFAPLLALAVIPAAGQTNLFVGTECGVYLSTDEGMSWTATNGGLTNTNVTSMESSGSMLFAGTNDGVFVSTDIGTSWTHTGLVNLQVVSLAIKDSLLFAGTYGNSVWKRPLSEMITVVGSAPVVVPTEFNLGQNFPNPFNPTTVIHYQIPSIGSDHFPPIRLSVYDVLGREVAILVNERKVPGEYAVTWNASGLPSGVYIYRISAGPFSDQKKLLLIR